MPVLRSILQGFGFTIGPSSRELDRVRRTRAKAAKKREREVERELAALKKRVRAG